MPTTGVRIEIDRMVLRGIRLTPEQIDRICRIVESELAMHPMRDASQDTVAIEKAREPVVLHGTAHDEWHIAQAIVKAIQRQFVSTGHP